MPKGFCTITAAHDEAGQPIALTKLIEWGLVTAVKAPAGWGIGQAELPLGYNIFTDSARQYLAYAATFRSPISNYTIQNYGVGTGVTAVTVGDVALQNPITLSSGTFLNQIDGVDYPAPFTAQVRFTLGVNDANGYLITEFGLFSGDGTLISHWITPGVSKTSSISYSLSHRLQF